jgi:16S rRNA (uracil1498-N3)-methyltransferase
MVEPMFRAALSGNERGTFVLDGAEGKHAATVRRIRVGEGIQVANGAGLRLRGKVAAVNAGMVSVDIESLEHEGRPAVAITLVQALAKGDRDELAIQAASELGAMKIVPWQAENSISRWDAAKAVKGQQRWSTIVQEAAKQSLRSFDPAVLPLATTADLVASLSGQVLVLDPTASVSLGQLARFEPEVSLIVGPEGGISPSELAAFEKAGFTRVRLGAEVLRTSTAGVAAISAIAALSGSWN